MRVHEEARLRSGIALRTVGSTVRKGFLTQQQLTSNHVLGGEQSRPRPLEASMATGPMYVAQSRLGGVFFGCLVHGLEVEVAMLLLSQSMLSPRKLLLCLDPMRMFCEKKLQNIGAFLEPSQLIQ